MRIYPVKQVGAKVKSNDKTLTGAEKIARVIALIIAFVTVYFFFFKILFL